MKIGLCPACLEERRLSKHHLFPKRHFGRKKNREVCMLCLDCHANLERVIADIEANHTELPLPKIQYRRILDGFICTKHFFLEHPQ